MQILSLSWEVETLFSIGPLSRDKTYQNRLRKISKVFLNFCWELIELYDIYILHNNIYI